MTEIPARVRSRLSRGERQSSVVAFDYILLLLLATIWGGSFLMQKVAVAEIPPVTMTAIRQVIASMVIGAILIFSGTWARASRKEHLLMFASAILGTALPFSLISIGVTKIDSGLAAILMGAMPLVTIVLAHFTTHDEPLNLNKLIAVGLGVVGLVVLFWPSITGGIGGGFFAQFLVLMAGVCYAVNSLVTRKVIHLEAPYVLSIIVFWSAILLVPAALLSETYEPMMPSLPVLLSILGLAIFPTVVASFLMYELIGRQGAGFFGQINLLVPVSGVFWGIAILGERPTWNAWAALAIILLGVGVSRNWNSSRASVKPKSETENQEPKI